MTSVKWYGRCRNIFVGHYNGKYVWIPEEIPAGFTPWNWPNMPWTPADMWLPHPPVRGRAKLRHRLRSLAEFRV